MGQRIWSVAAGVTMTWRFTTPSGSITVAPEPPLLGSGPGDASVLVLLAYHGATPATAAHSWSVVTPPAPAQVPGLVTLPVPDQVAADVCQVGESFVGSLAQAQLPNGYGLSVPNDRGIEGCALQLLQSAPLSTVQGTFLWRFGALLAVDKGAHTLVPWLPIAPQAEVVAVEG